MTRRSFPNAFPRLMFGWMLVVLGALVLVGGVVLAALGGSPYYLLAGSATMVSAVLFLRRNILGSACFALLLIGTALWALWDAGADGWALAGRLMAPAVLGLFFFAFRKDYPDSPSPARRALALSAPAAGLSILVLISVAAIATQWAPADSSPRALAEAEGGANGEWPAYAGTLAGDHFSQLTQISPGNVGKLEAAWRYDTGVVQKGTPTPLETTPLMLGNKLYLCTQTNIVIALDPDTGQQKWRFDPKVDPTGASVVTTCRGVAYYRASGSTDCPERIITATFDMRLIALNAETGKFCPSFGKNGVVDLGIGMGHVEKGFSYQSSAPTIVNGNIVIGGWIIDNQSTDEPSGVIRAFDATTGKFAWAWDIGRLSDNGLPPPGKTFTRSTPNSWAPMSADEALNLVYVPTGSASPDHWGGNRSPQTERFANSIVALDASTGRLRWSFQTVHHDLWDYDVASQPTLLTIRRGGQSIPAVAQPTKQGDIYLLDRRNGKLLSPVVERPVPQNHGIIGDRTASTQPYSVGFPSFGGEPLRESDMWGVTPLDQLWCRIEFRRIRYQGKFTPPGTDRSLTYPGIGGGMNWGGVAVDRRREIMIVNSLSYATIVQLVPRREVDRLRGKSAADSHAADFDLPFPQTGAPYGVRISGFESPLKVPCNKPPYGKLSAIDLRTNKLLWSRPIGTTQDTGPLGIASRLPIPMGMPMYGGPLITASGLTFIGATQNRDFRALDTATGRVLWSARIPASAHANPMTYRSGKTGRQYVVIAASGSVALRSPMGNSIVAFALPDAE